MTGESKFHLSIVWVILTPSLKTPFWAKVSMTAGKVYPAGMRLDIQVLLHQPSSQEECDHQPAEKERTQPVVLIISFTPPVGCDLGASSLHVPGALFNVPAWCLGMLWLTGVPLLAAVGQNSPFPQRFSPGMGRCGCTHTGEAGGILAMPQALSSLQADP